MSTKPVQPGTELAKRFAQTYSYGFYLKKRATESIDEIINDSERWVILNINPQSLSWREPMATSISPTQGGGKIIESRGGILRYGQISGTTGHLPPRSAEGNVVSGIDVDLSSSRDSLTPEDPDLDLRLGVRSGFYKFHTLRHLFRLYGWERRRGNLNATLHYMDFKSDEFWRIEPQEFSMQRNSRRPFLYDYNISFTAIEPSEAVSSAVGLTTASFISPIYDVSNFTASSVGDTDAWVRSLADRSTTSTVGRMLTMRQAGLGTIQRLSGDIQRKFQNALQYVTKITQFFDDIKSASTTILDLPVSILRLARGAVIAFMQSVDGFNITNIKEELNEWGLEMLTLLNSLTAGYISSNTSGVATSTNDAFTTSRARQGFTDSFLQEPANSSGSLSYNPYIGANGLGLVTDISALSRSGNTRAVPIMDGDTVWSLALRFLGDVNRFVDLVILNDLSHPYIVSDRYNKPSGTLAWGESLLIPADADPSLVDSLETDLGSMSYTGLCTATGSSIDLIDTTVRSSSWRINQWVGYTITLRPGSSTEEIRVVTASSEDVLTVNYAWIVAPVVDDEYTLSLVTMIDTRPVTPEAMAYGKDMLLSFRRPGLDVYGSPRATIVINARGDIAMVSGEDNLMQAVHLRGETELGTHTFHKSFGVLMPIGRPWRPSTALFYSYFIRQSMLSDPRISTVKNARLTLSGSVMTFSAEIQPVQARRTRLVSISAR